MKISPVMQRMAENEIVFRKHNETVLKGLEEVKTLANESMQVDLIPSNDTPLHFYCECSDENCRKRVVLTPDQYRDIHKKRDQFVLIPGHEAKKIEQIIKKKSDFSVVKKYFLPSSRVKGLKSTPINNN